MARYRESRRFQGEQDINAIAEKGKLRYEERKQQQLLKERKEEEDKAKTKFNLPHTNLVAIGDADDAYILQSLQRLETVGKSVCYLNPPNKTELEYITFMHVALDNALHLHRKTKNMYGVPQEGNMHTEVEKLIKLDPITLSAAYDYTQLLLEAYRRGIYPPNNN